MLGRCDASVTKPHGYEHLANIEKLYVLKHQRELPSGPRRSVSPRAPRMGGVGQRVHKPLLGVADTNHLLSIYIWVMFGNAEQQLI